MSTIKNEALLRVYHNSTQEELIQQLQNQDSTNEFYLNIFLYELIGDIFSTCSSFLRQKEDISKLTIQVEVNKFLNFEETFYKLKDFTQIKKLCINLNNQIYYLSQQKIMFAECFSNSTYLLELEINLNCSKLEEREHLFRMKTLYQSIPNLKKLNLNLHYIPEKSVIVCSILEGVRFLKSLENLSLSLNHPSTQNISILECLDGEIEENTQLKELKLTFSCDFDYTGFKMISKILKKLHNLENLTLEIPFIEDSFQEKEEFGFEECFLSLSNLKFLNLNLGMGSGSISKYCKVVDMMSLNLSLVDIHLHSNIKILHNEDLNLFGRSLQKILNLSTLKIIFNDNIPLEYSQFIQFIGGLSILKNLKHLYLYPSDITQQKEEVSEGDIQLFRQTLSQLKSFYFMDHREQNQYYVEEAIHQVTALEDLYLSIGKLFFQFDKKPTINKENERIFINPLSNKSQLKKIDLRVSYFHILDVNQQQDLIQQMSNNIDLQEFSLSLQNITNYSTLVNQLGESLNKLTKLKSIKLIFNKETIIEDEGFLRFAQSLKELSNLNLFHIQFNADKIRNETLKQFATSFSNMTELETLCIENSSEVTVDQQDFSWFLNELILPNKIDNLCLRFKTSNLKFYEIEHLFQQISQLKLLTYLSLYFDTLELSLEEAMRMRNYLSKLQLLGSIVMTSYSMNLLYLMALFQDIRGLTHIQFHRKYTSSQLEQVDAQREYVLASEQIPKLLNESVIDNQDIFLDEISLQIKNNQGLFMKNEIQSSTRFIFEKLISLSKFKLFIPYNCLGSESSMELFKQFSKLSNLKQLTLEIMSTNQITEESLNLLGEALVRMPKLKELRLEIQTSENDIDVKNTQRFFSNLGRLNQLTYLKIKIDFEEQFGMIGCPEDNEFFNNFCQSLSQLVNLNTLKLITRQLDMTEESIDALTQTFKYHETNLKYLSIQLHITSEVVQRKLIKGLFKLKNLHIIKIRLTDFNQKQLLKLDRLTVLSHESQEYRRYRRVWY